MLAHKPRIKGGDAHGEGVERLTRTLASLLHTMQNFRGGHASPHKPGHRCPHDSFFSHRWLHSRLQGALGRRHPSDTQGAGPTQISLKLQGRGGGGKGQGTRARLLHPCQPKTAAAWIAAFDQAAAWQYSWLHSGLANKLCVWPGRFHALRALKRTCSIPKWLPGSQVHCSPVPVLAGHTPVTYFSLARCLEHRPF